MVAQQWWGFNSWRGPCLPIIGRAVPLISTGDMSGAGNTILQGTGTGPVIDINEDILSVTLQQLRITGGFGSRGSGIFNQSDLLTVTDCTITGNIVTGPAGGGGINNSTTSNLVMTRCTVSNNTAAPTRTGGGIQNEGQMTLTNCQIKGNIAGTEGAGIYNSGTAALDATSVTNNIAGADGGGIFNFTGATVDLTNGSTVSSNTVGGVANNCVGSGFTGTGCA